MRLLALAWMGLLFLAGCSAGEPDGGSDASIARVSQFLGSCTQSCAAPLRCVCGMCTAPCDGDEACGRYSGLATCVAPPSESGCDSSERSCDVPCTHDGSCEPFGNDFVCLVGRCRRQDPPSGTDDDGGTTSGGLLVCKMGAPRVGLCVFSADDLGAFSNDGPALEGKITALDAPVQVKCFGSENHSAAIPVAAHADEEPIVPAGTSFWHVESNGVTYTVALAAPGLDALGVKVGDDISLRNSVSWAGSDWLFGNAEVDIAGRGHVLIAINDSSRLAVSDGPTTCEVPGPCGGEEWSMRITVDGSQISVPPFESVAVGSSTFTNAGALTHRPEYMEADESTQGTPGCRGEPRTNFVAARVDAL